MSQGLFPQTLITQVAYLIFSEEASAVPQEYSGWPPLGKRKIWPNTEKQQNWLDFLHAPRPPVAEATLYHVTRVPTVVKSQPELHYPCYRLSTASASAFALRQKCWSCTQSVGNHGKANGKGQSRVAEMQSTHSMFLAQWEHGSTGGRGKREGQRLFMHSRVLCSTGISHALLNTLKESTYTRFSKISTSVLHRSL